MTGGKKKNKKLNHHDGRKEKELNQGASLHRTVSLAELRLCRKFPGSWDLKPLPKDKLDEDQADFGTSAKPS